MSKKQIIKEVEETNKLETKEVSKEQEYLEALQRLQAEFSNYQKRMEKEQINFMKFAKEDLITKILDVFENFERALKEVKDEGVKLIHKQFLEILEKEGVKEIETQGDFNPNLHEAIMKEKSNKKEGAILEVFSKGFMLNGKVIRASKVKISGGNKE